MINIKLVKSYCCGDISKIENYDKALADTENMWYCHHRLETHSRNGERLNADISKIKLIEEKMYFNRPCEELIFVTKSDHVKMHKFRKGKPCPEETKERLSAMFYRRPVICVETGIKYNSVGDIERKTGIRRENVRSCCSGRVKTAGGYHWKYEE